MPQYHCKTLRENKWNLLKFSETMLLLMLRKRLYINILHRFLNLNINYFELQGVPKKQRSAFKLNSEKNIKQWNYCAFSFQSIFIPSAADCDWKFLKGHFDETLGADFFYFLKLRFLKYIPVKYQHKILSRKLSKFRWKIRILRPPLIWACF